MMLLHQGKARAIFYFRKYTSMFRFLSMILVLGIAIKVVYTMNKDSIKTAVNETKVVADVQKTQEKLPMTLENGLHLEKAEYIDHVARMYATEPFKQEASESQREQYKKDVIQYYCKGFLKVFYDGNARIEYVFKTLPHSLNDLSTTTWSAKVEPADCR